MTSEDRNIEERQADIGLGHESMDEKVTVMHTEDFHAAAKTGQAATDKYISFCYFALSFNPDDLSDMATPLLYSTPRSKPNCA